MLTTVVIALTLLLSTPAVAPLRAASAPPVVKVRKGSEGSMIVEAAKETATEALVSFGVVETGRDGTHTRSSARTGAVVSASRPVGPLTSCSRPSTGLFKTI